MIFMLNPYGMIAYGLHRNCDAFAIAARPNLAIRVRISNLGSLTYFFMAAPSFATAIGEGFAYDDIWLLGSAGGVGPILVFILTRASSLFVAS
jgi:hypothetical protein